MQDKPVITVCSQSFHHHCKCSLHSCCTTLFPIPQKDMIVQKCLFFLFLFFKLGNKMNLYERVTKRPAADCLFCWLTLGVSWVLTETFWYGWRTRWAALLIMLNVFFSCSRSLFFFFCLFFYSIQDHSGALEVTEELQMGWGTFPVALWCTFILFLILVVVKRLRVTAQTSFSDSIIICFLCGFGSICKQTRKHQGFLAVICIHWFKREQGCIHQERDRGLKSPVPASACHTDIPQVCPPITLQLLETL